MNLINEVLSRGVTKTDLSNWYSISRPTINKLQDNDTTMSENLKRSLSKALNNQNGNMDFVTKVKLSAALFHATKAFEGPLSYQSKDLQISKIELIRDILTAPENAMWTLKGLKVMLEGLISGNKPMIAMLDHLLLMNYASEKLNTENINDDTFKMANTYRDITGLNEFKSKKEYLERIIESNRKADKVEKLFDNSNYK